MNNRKARLQAFAPKICYEAEMFVALQMNALVRTLYGIG